MLSGKLDRRLTIREPIETQSVSGEIITTWNDLATVWAQQVNLNGYERYSGSQVVGRALMTYRLRYSSTTKRITTKWRVIVEGREFDVTDVREPKKRSEIQLDCFSRSEDQVVP